jgi:hypothetical protein
LILAVFDESDNISGIIIDDQFLLKLTNNIEHKTKAGSNIIVNI